MILRRARSFVTSACVVMAILSSGCSGSSAGPTPPPDADTTMGSEAGAEAGLTASLAGTVTDRAGLPVLGAKVEAGDGVSPVFSDAQGKYAFANLVAGPVTINVTQVWFQPFAQSLTLPAGAPTALDVVLDEMPLKVEPADRALADSYNQTFDWSKQTISVAIAETPTRCAFDNAIYFHNPALYRNTSAQPPLVPSPQPTIAGASATGFTFPVGSGPNQGQEALDLTSIVDSIVDTPLGPTEPINYMIWNSTINWLTEWDAAKSVTLKVVGLAVRQQGWGGNAIRPQEIEKVFLDPNTNRLWVKVVFENFVQLGAGITDDDGDGRKEIYAAVASAHYTSEMVNALANTYAKTTFSTHGLSKEVSKSLNELYSTTGAQVERYIGQPFDVPGLGTITYPFVVLRHAGGQKNVILVAGAP
jgi:hypothetical protein